MSKLGVALAACLALGGCAWNLGRTDVVPQGVAHDGWIVEVSVEPSDLGPVVVSVGPTRPRGPHESRAWVEHDLVFENTGNRPVTFADSRTAKRLGPRRKPLLLVADQGCGYSLYEGRIELVCLTYLDIPTVKPHGVLKRTVTLWKGLRGMGRLEPGTYVFRKKVHFQLGEKPPTRGAGRTATLRIVYQVDAA